jgi:hypothetical protein
MPMMAMAQMMDRKAPAATTMLFEKSNPAPMCPAVMARSRQQPADDDLYPEPAVVLMKDKWTDRRPAGLP